MFISRIAHTLLAMYLGDTATARTTMKVEPIRSSVYSFIVQVVRNNTITMVTVTKFVIFT